MNATPLTLARLEQIAIEFDPFEHGEPSALLWAISLADELAPDPEAEPSLGWIGNGPAPIWDGWTDRADYEARNCLDLEGDSDNGPRPVRAIQIDGGAR